LELYRLEIESGASFMVNHRAFGTPDTHDYIAAIDTSRLKALEELRVARRELTKVVEPIPEIMVMEELPKAKPAYILKRGAYDSHGEKVTADTPKSLPPLPNDLPRNRLGIAH